MSRVNANNYEKMLQEAASVLAAVSSHLSKGDDNIKSAVAHIDKALICLGQKAVRKVRRPGELLQKNTEEG